MITTQNKINIDLAISTNTLLSQRRDDLKWNDDWLQEYYEEGMELLMCSFEQTNLNTSK